MASRITLIEPHFEGIRLGSESTDHSDEAEYSDGGIGSTIAFAVLLVLVTAIALYLREHRQPSRDETSAAPPRARLPLF